MNVKELTHSQQQPQAPKTHKKKPTIRQAIRKVMVFFTHRMVKHENNNKTSGLLELFKKTALNETTWEGIS